MQLEHQSTAAPSARQLVERYWNRMASNDFKSVRDVCSDDLIVEYPQSRERFVGVERYAQMNQEYPAHGRWQFELRRLVTDQQHAVTEVAVTDGVQKGLAISFFTVEAGFIKRIVEYWPEAFAAPANRAHLAETMERDLV